MHGRGEGASGGARGRGSQLRRSSTRRPAGPGAPARLRGRSPQSGSSVGSRPLPPPPGPPAQVRRAGRAGGRSFRRTRRGAPSCPPRRAAPRRPPGTPLAPEPLTVPVDSSPAPCSPGSCCSGRPAAPAARPRGVCGCSCGRWCAAGRAATGGSRRSDCCTPGRGPRQVTRGAPAASGSPARPARPPCCFAALREGRWALRAEPRPGGARPLPAANCCVMRREVGAEPGHIQ